LSYAHVSVLVKLVCSRRVMGNGWRMCLGCVPIFRRAQRELVDSMYNAREKNEHKVRLDESGICAGGSSIPSGPSHVEHLVPKEQVVTTAWRGQSLG
jgi:hypothetical protein